ncbi:MAG: HAD family phosphatase [Planctomycetaceae bacterium]
MTDNSEFGVIFDVDGVLVDSYDAHFQAWRTTMTKYGWACTEADFATGFGRTSREVLRSLLGDELPDETIRQFDEEKEALFRRAIAEDFPAMPGAVELLRNLAAEGVPMAIGSSAPPPNVQAVMDALNANELISTVITGVDVTIGKPHPEVFLLGARGLGLHPSRCVVLEDAPPGVEAALAAGSRCLGVVSRGRTREELHRADAHVSDLTTVTADMLRSIVNGEGQCHAS